MGKPYIRISGRYTAAVENEKATIEFIREHLGKEMLPTREVKRVVEDLSSWFKQNPEGIRTHTIKVPGKNDTAIIVSRIPRL